MHKSVVSNLVFPMSFTLLMSGVVEEHFDSLKSKIEESIADTAGIPFVQNGIQSVKASFKALFGRRSIDAKMNPERRSSDASISVSIKPDDPDQEAHILNEISRENDFLDDLNVKLQAEGLSVNSMLDFERINTYPGKLLKTI